MKLELSCLVSLDDLNLMIRLGYQPAIYLITSDNHFQIGVGVEIEKNLFDLLDSWGTYPLYPVNKNE